MIPRTCCLTLFAAGLWAEPIPSQGAVETWAPVRGGVPAAGFVVDMKNRLEALCFYHAVFAASEGAENRIGWTGVFGMDCKEGSTSAVFRTDVQRRVNYYRAICGLPAAITFDTEPAVNDPSPTSPKVGAGISKHACAQAAAHFNASGILFEDAFVLSHTPSPTTRINCWPQVWNGCFQSNLTIGYFGPRAVDVYIADDNLLDNSTDNSIVGHRRWILYSRARDMSSGDVPPGVFTDTEGTANAVQSANALYVAGVFQPEASAPIQFVTWPPAGYVPEPLKPLRWSISYSNAVFSASAATITVKGPDGKVIPVKVISWNEKNYGDNTLVFVPEQTTITGLGDAEFSVTVTGMSGPGVPASHTWQTTFFDPSVLGVDQTVTGPAQPSSAGADYQSSVVPFASSYELMVNPALPAAGTYVENGDGTNPDITAEKTGTYPVLQGKETMTYKDATGKIVTNIFTPRGINSLHLCFPRDDSESDGLPHNQSFSLGPEFIPSATSMVSFQELFRWLFTVNRLSLEISSDGGSKWREIYGRNGSSVYVAGGPGYRNTDWDTAWSERSVSLAAYAGRPVRLRFILRHNNIAFDTASIVHGCYVDDITLTGVKRLANGVKTIFPTPELRLDSQSAGTPLVVGNSYLIRVRAKMGFQWMGYSPLLTVTAKPPTGFEAANPTLAATPLGDADGDGISNFVEYAFGLNALIPGGAGALPQPSMGGGNISLAFTIPTAVTDVDYSGECSSNLASWGPVANTGTGSRPAFTVPVLPGQKCYLRLKVRQR